MSGSYGVGTNYLAFTAGGAGAAGTGAFTILCLVQPGVGNNNAGFCGLYASTTLTRAIFEDTNKLFGVNDFSSGFSTLTQGTWYLVGITKAAGSNLWRFHVWPYDSSGAGTFSHGTSTGAANQGDGSAITQIRIGANAVASNGLIACVGIWTSALSDADIDTLRSANLSTWAALSPAELISLENWNGTSGADIKAGTSSFSATTGTVSSGSNPPSFNFSVSSSTNANAEATTGTGAASDATAALGANAATTTGTGAAGDAVAAITANAETTSATGTAFDATVSTATIVNANAEATTGTGTANNAVVSVAPAAESTAATGVAFDAAVGIGVTAESATGTGSALAATISGGALAEPATATGSALVAALAIQANAAAAAALGISLTPTTGGTTIKATSTSSVTAGQTSTSTLSARATSTAAVTAARTSTGGVT